MTRNQVLMHFRRNQGRPAAEGGSAALGRLLGVADPLPLEADEGEQAQMDRVYRDAVNLVRGEFEEATWRAFWLTAIEGRAPAALADELGMNAAAIRQARSRVLRRLEQELGDLLE